jgi:hypothetical protein
MCFDPFSRVLLGQIADDLFWRFAANEFLCRFKTSVKAFFVAGLVAFLLAAHMVFCAVLICFDPFVLPSRALKFAHSLDGHFVERGNGVTASAEEAPHLAGFGDLLGRSRPGLLARSALDVHFHGSGL